MTALMPLRTSPGFPKLGVFLARRSLVLASRLRLRGETRFLRVHFPPGELRVSEQTSLSWAVVYAVSITLGSERGLKPAIDNLQGDSRGE